MRLSGLGPSAREAARAGRRIAMSLSARALQTTLGRRAEQGVPGFAGQGPRRARLHTAAIEAARTGLRVVMSHKVRSFLTMLGIVMGVGGIVGIVVEGVVDFGTLQRERDDGAVARDRQRR